MSLLAPLYIAGLLAVSLPILFHLIRRTPQGKQPFSSLMFLDPSPPRLTRRSRLNNLLLLILRGLALAILAFAFARPFLYRDSDLSVSEQQGRRVALLLDTSASMRRGDLWTQATKQVEATIDELEAGDEVALFAFDDSVRPLLTFTQWNELEPSARLPALRLQLAAIKPAWRGTNLGDALTTVADALADAQSAGDAAAVRRQIVLITDMQQGSRLESLLAYEWPGGVLIDVKTVRANDTANASLQLVKESDETAAEAEKGLRLRVSNEASSNREQFTIAWTNTEQPENSAKPVNVYVAPSRSKIVRVPWSARQGPADALALRGDAQDFDNTLFVVPPRKETLRLLYIGDDSADDAQGLQYYLRGAVADTPTRAADFIARRSEQPIDTADLLDTRLVVVSADLSEDSLDRLRAYLEGGGRMLYVLREAAAAAAGAAKLLKREAFDVSEASPMNYSLLGRVDFDHPLFAPFSNPRFSDFTSIHFWKHRRLMLDGDNPPRVLAAFDSGDPFLVEYKVGGGSLLLATAGWHPADSQLALSTKFVPLIAVLTAPRSRGIAQVQHIVGDRIELPAQTANAKRSVRLPNGAETELSSDATTFDATDEPGTYHFSLGGEDVAVAVNISADESRTAPLAVEELEDRGARLGVQPSAGDLAAVERQLKMNELEQRQKLWRWLIVGVCGVLVAETALAGRLAHKTQAQVTA
jgi:hypothetical protein